VLNGIFGRPVALASGERVVADEAYVRESITSPAARVVAGYQPVMPTYLGQVSEEQVISLIAYIESLQAPSQAAPAGAAPPSRAKGARSR
jgi:cytochrome c oxidase subunit 2